MDAISYSKAAQQEQRIKKIIAEPDSVAGLVSVPNLVPTGETITIPAGRTVVHPSLQVDGTLVVDGTLFIPSGGTYTADELDVTVVKQNGNVVANLNSPSLTGTPTAPTAAVGTDTTQLATCALVKASMKLAPRMQLMTAQNSTSGTSIDFTGIPSWVKKITVMFNGVSTSGTSYSRVQLGSSSIQSTGYLGTVTRFSTSAVASANFTNGFDGYDSLSAGDLRNGQLIFTNLSSNIWCVSGGYGLSNSVGLCSICGSVTLSGILDRIRITTVNGTDTFDAGQINVLYEG